MSVLTSLKDAWINRDKIGDGSKQRDLAAFLPAALEIQDTPPNPLARWLALSVILLVILAVVWACFGQINIVASAEGKIIPTSRTKQVQAFAKGVVKGILVKEGSYVTEGQALIELEQTLTIADLNRLKTEKQSAEERLLIDKALLRLIELSAAQTITAREIQQVLADTAMSSSQATVGEQALNEQLLQQRWLEYWSQKQSLKSALSKTLAEQAGSKEIIVKLQKTLPIIEKRTETLKGLLDNNYVSELDFYQSEAERIQVVQDLAAEKQRLNQLRAAQDEVKEQIKTQTAQKSAAILTNITDLQRQITALEEEVIKSRDLNAKQVIYAPVTGRVQELAVTTIGAVVSDAQKLMIIVPEENELEATVYIENKDIGFVEEGMQAEIKVHTFPFTKYGVIDAEVVNISNDATLDDQRGLIYGMQLKMKKNSLWVNGKEVRLMPGMGVTAEVKTGYRRVIEFFLSPLLRKGKEGLRER